MKRTLISDASNKDYLQRMLSSMGFDPMDDLGWKLEEGNRVPKDPGGLSRMYLIRQDKDGRDTLMAYDGHQLADGTKLEIKSTEFWEQIQMGNVIAFPLGDTKPVQLQIDDINIKFSKPLEPSQIPMRTPNPLCPPGQTGGSDSGTAFSRAHTRRTLSSTTTRRPHTGGGRRSAAP
jgi:hypothetical protein